VLSRLQAFAVSAHGATARRSQCRTWTKAMASYVCNQYLRSDSQSHSIVAASMAAHYTGLSPEAGISRGVRLGRSNIGHCCTYATKPRCCRVGHQLNGMPKSDWVRICRQVKIVSLCPQEANHSTRAVPEIETYLVLIVRAVLASATAQVEWAPAETSKLLSLSSL
jgi:hypothetical protein